MTQVVARNVPEVATETAELAALWRKARPVDSDWTLGHVTAAAARTFPNAPAIADASTRLSFLQLHERTLGLASQLARLGVRRSDRVLLWATKHVECVIAMFAIARLGATFVPVDPAVPPERLEFLLQDVEARALVGRLPLVTDAARARLMQIPCLDLALASSFELDPATHQHESPAVPTDAVYVLFTSGSTGKPKGVTIEHRQVESFFIGHNERARINPGDRCLNTGPLYFDVFVLDVLLPLYRGAFVQLGPQLPVASVVLSMLERERITHVYAVGTVLGLITGNGDRLDAYDLSALRVLQTGAEVCNPAVVNHWLRRLPSLTFINSYGPTEVTVGCINFLKTSPGLLSGDVPIGTPHRGTQVALVSCETGECVTAVGAIGELWLAGEQVMRGYLRRPQEERRALVMRAGVLYYRSGDLAYSDAEGNLHFAGRVDDEIKHSGYRIQPNEIRATLRACPDVKDAVVGVLAKSSPQQQIAAVVSISKERDPDHVLSAVLTHMKRHLPAYMHPTQYRLCDELTINQNGKCNVHSMFEQMEKELSR